MKAQVMGLRVGLGGLAILLGVGGLVWLALIFSVQYSYGRLTQEIQDEKPDHARLVSLKLNLEQLLQRDPTNGEVRNMYATVLGRLGQYPEAVRELDIARKTVNNRNSLFFLADMYERMNDIPRAEAMMRDCLLINPTDSHFNPARLHLLFERFTALHKKMMDGELRSEEDKKAYAQYRDEYARAALNWGIRAFNDKNSYLFLANFYVNSSYAEQAYYIYGQQAYRCLLLGLSGAPWISLNAAEPAMIDEKNALAMLGMMIDGTYAKPYRNLR